jgi:hypothetical protein
MLRYGSASAAHSSGTTVLPGSYDLSNFSGGRSTGAFDGMTAHLTGATVDDRHKHTSRSSGSAQVPDLSPSTGWGVRQLCNFSGARSSWTANLGCSQLEFLNF